jgi:hypothetical protein
MCGEDCGLIGGLFIIGSSFYGGTLNGKRLLDCFSNHLSVMLNGVPI